MANNRRFRVIFSTVLVLALILSAFPVTALAATREEAKEAIRQAYEQRIEKLDLGPYNLTIDELHDLFFELYNGGELPWYASRSYRYFYSGNQATAIEPQFLDETVYNRAVYEQKVADILAKTVKPGMSHLQIALAIHDYLCAYGVYDETYTLYQGYELLVGGTAVCQGYAEAYMDLLQRAGLECILIESTPMDHCWNLVKLDGNWYHIDSTWDDPITDVEGRTQHDNFLLSDGGIAQAGSKGHNSWETDIRCPSTTYDTAWWSDVTSSIWYESADTCYLRRSDSNIHTILRRNETTGTEEVLYTFDAGYVDIGGGPLHYYHYGLTLYEGRLYFNSMDTVWSTDLAGGDLRVEYSMDPLALGQVIFGTHVENDMIHMTLKDVQDNQTRTEVPLAHKPAHTHNYTATKTEATCLAEGFTTYTCGCGHSYTDDFTPLGDHKYDAGILVREATPTQPGRKVFTCIHCGYSYGEDVYYTPPTTPTVPGPNPGTNPGPTGTVGSQIAETAGKYAEDLFIGFCLVLSLLLLPGTRRKKNK